MALQEVCSVLIGRLKLQSAQVKHFTETQALIVNNWLQIHVDTDMGLLCFLHPQKESKWYFYSTAAELYEIISTTQRFLVR